MTADEARNYLLGHDKMCKMLNRQKISDLRTIERTLLERRGMTRIYGGPHSKDELIHAILDMEYPDAAAARVAYYASVMV